MLLWTRVMEMDLVSSSQLKKKKKEQSVYWFDKQENQ